MFLSIHLWLNTWRAALSQESSLKESLKSEQCRFCLFQCQDCFFALQAGFIVSVFVSGLYCSLLTVKIPSAHETSAWVLSLSNPAWTENRISLRSSDTHTSLSGLMVCRHKSPDMGSFLNEFISTARNGKIQKQFKWSFLRTQLWVFAFLLLIWMMIAGIIFKYDPA